MVKIPIATSDWRRLVADEAELIVKNRYFEQNPTNLDGGSSLLSRPGLKRWLEVGTGPITQIYSQPGSFGGCLFVASGEDLYRVDTDETVTLIGAGIYPTGTGTPQMAATSSFGDTPEYLFTCAGGVLWVYLEDGFARNTLTFTGQPTAGDVVRIGDVYYSFQAGSLDTGAPAGTVGNPWKVLIGASLAATVANFYNAVAALGTAGTDYSTALVEHPLVTIVNYTGTVVSVRAKTFGATGNVIVTTETGSNTVWENPATLEDGGSPGILQVPTPDDVGMITVAYISSFIVVIPAQDQGINGRFYWINPGETTIEALNFATAERSPDPILDARVMGDQIWFFGSNSTEVWYPSGDADLPFSRMQGKLFDHGVVQGTALQVGDALMVVDSSGVVYQVGGGMQRVSNNSIEERIRNAIKEMALADL